MNKKFNKQIFSDSFIDDLKDERDDLERFYDLVGPDGVVVIDNVDHNWTLLETLTKYFPPNSCGNPPLLLITTRNTEFIDTQLEIPAKNFPEQDAVEFVEASLKEKKGKKLKLIHFAFCLIISPLHYSRLLDWIYE